MANRLNKLLLIPAVLFSLSACEIFSVPKEENVTEATAEEIAEFQDAGQGTYYVSDLYQMHSTIAGYFTYGRPYTIENDNPNVHIYNNLCLYEGDEFFIAKNKARAKGDFLPNFDYCFELKEKADEEYVKVDVAEGDPTCGSLFLKEGKDGEYKISFDVETKLIDIEFIKQIDTPRYDYISHCDISEIHFKKTSYKTLRENPENKDELCISDYEIPMHASVIFDNNLGCYTRVWLSDTYFNQARTFTKRELIHFSAGGNYNVFLNRKDYTVRLELNNPETASYCCYYSLYGADFTSMTRDTEHPYIFHLNNFSNRNGESGYYATIRFADVEEGEPGSFKYKLEPQDENITRNDSNNYSFTSGGIFNITVNLKEGTVSAQKVE